ncbi:MAG: S-adenosylmethionine decarboxylase [Nitrospinae bacterium]|nr:S-adenosylmethionine decarboxylase [Nitrospinota bacterium]
MNRTISNSIAHSEQNDLGEGVASQGDGITGRQVYGFELILDLHGCEAELFNRDHIDKFFTDLCTLIKMEKCEVHFWDDVGVPEEERQTLPHTKGTSAVCFILTSTIVIHTLDILGAVYVNIFSCKSFDPEVAAEFTSKRFKAASCKKTFIERTL